MARRTGGNPPKHREMFERPLVEQYGFVMVATRNLSAARTFWVRQLGFPVTAEIPNRSLELDVGGLRLLIDLQPTTQAAIAEPDPIIWLQVRSLEMALSALAARGITEDSQKYADEKGRRAILHDPDGRAVVLYEGP